jgi:hypothetical protein
LSTIVLYCTTTFAIAAAPQEDGPIFTPRPLGLFNAVGGCGHLLA